MAPKRPEWLPQHGERCEVRDDPGTMVTIEERYYGTACDIEDKEWLIRSDGGRHAIPPYTTTGIRKEFKPTCPRVVIHPAAVELATRLESEWMPDVVIWKTLKGEFTCEQIVRAVRMKTVRGNDFLGMYERVCLDFVRRMAKRKVYEMATDSQLEERVASLTSVVDRELTAMPGIGEAWVGEAWKDEETEEKVERGYRDRLFHLRNVIAKALAGAAPVPDASGEPVKRLQEFLYLLMRDHIPTSRCAETVKVVETCPGDKVVYTAKGLAAYAKELAERILQ